MRAETVRATSIGFAAIPIWSLLPPLTVAAGSIPPLELVALTFSAGSLAGLLFPGWSPAARKDLRRAGIGPVLLGTAGLFAYHFELLANGPAAVRAAHP
ncbi:MAG: hypothetical protein ACLPWS_01985 [Rhodomicrobium sp.]